MKKDKDLVAVLKRLRPYSLKILLSVFFSVLSVVGTLLAPMYFGKAIDCVVGVGKVDFSAMLAFLLKAGVFVGISAILQWVAGVINNSVTFSIVRDLRRDAFAKLQELPLSYLDSHRSGETISRIIGDTDSFADGLLMGFTQLFTGVTTIIFTLAFMFALNVYIALAVVVLTPLSLIIARFISRRTHSMFVAQSEAKAEQTALIDEAISNQKTIRAFSHEKDILARFDECNEALNKRSLSAVFFSSLVNPTTRFINSTVYAAVVCFGALSATGLLGAGAVITVGTLSVFLSYTNQYTKPFNEISGVITELQAAMAGARRVFELIDRDSEVSDKNNLELITVEGNVKLTDVSFSYSPERELIKDFNLFAKKGQRVAIVGPTGCGKTTVINLLMRFYDVQGGSVAVDGHDVRDLTRKSLRTGYGMVLQETWLKSGTIRENIAMGKPDASQEEIENAAKLSYADDFIKKLPNGYDTVIGEEDSLSQGQKQLLCIARVMLCRPPVLILDEATSSIDTRTEVKIQQAFAELMRGRTSFIVAHRLSTVREADAILVMNAGRIIEIGTHDELLKKGGFYSNLYGSQFA